jgi:hypothetical protein
VVGGGGGGVRGWRTGTRGRVAASRGLGKFCSASHSGSGTQGGEEFSVDQVWLSDFELAPSAFVSVSWVLLRLQFQKYFSATG